jgi:uncharacterized protein
VTALNTGYAFNRTRSSFLATRLRFAQTHWSRFAGLMCVSAQTFTSGQGLWISPSRGVHTLAMRFPIDVLYLDAAKVVVYLEPNLQPWRIAPIKMGAASVLELPAQTVQTSGTALGDQIVIAEGEPKLDEELEA